MLAFILVGCGKSSDDSDNYAGIEGYWQIKNWDGDDYPLVISDDGDGHSVLQDTIVRLIKGKTRQYHRFTYINFSKNELEIIYAIMELIIGFKPENGVYYNPDKIIPYTINDNTISYSDGFDEYTATYIVGENKLTLIEEDSYMILKRVKSSVVAGARTTPAL